MRIHSFGSGPPLVVVPGVQGRWEWFRPAVDALARQCRVTAFSLCGDLGSGRRLDRALGFDNYLRQLDEVFEASGTPAALCGISYGGFIALRYAATRPERVAALILASAPAPGWTPSKIQSAYIAHPWIATPAFVLTSPFRMWPEIRAAFDTWTGRARFSVRQLLRVAAHPMIPGLMAARIVEQQNLDFRGDAAAVRAPTLVLSGQPELDLVVPVASTRRYAEMIPGARYVMLERTGHLGLVTRPDAFAAPIADFVHAHAR